MLLKPTCGPRWAERMAARCAIDCVLVDEAQFLLPIGVQLARLADEAVSLVLCYGLRSDFHRGSCSPVRRLLLALPMRWWN